MVCSCHSAAVVFEIQEENRSYGVHDQQAQSVREKLCDVVSDVYCQKTSTISNAKRAYGCVENGEGSHQIVSRDKA